MDLSKMRERTKLRKIAGQDVPRQNRTSKAFAKAESAAKNAPYAGESGIDVEGNKPRPRLDRPARASGGRVCRADGGPTLSKEREDYAEKKEAEKKDAEARGGVGGAAAGVGLGLLGAKSLLGKAAGTALGVTGLHSAGKEMLGRRDARREAEWARSGKAEDGKEDRKRGGRVSKSEDC